MSTQDKEEVVLFRALPLNPTPRDTIHSNNDSATPLQYPFNGNAIRQNKRRLEPRASHVVTLPHSNNRRSKHIFVRHSQVYSHKTQTKRQKAVATTQRAQVLKPKRRKDQHSKRHISGTKRDKETD